MVRFKNFQGLEFYAIPAKFLDASKKQEEEELDLIKIQEEHLAEELRKQKEAELKAEEEAKALEVARFKQFEEELQFEKEALKVEALAKEKADKKAKLQAELAALEE